MTPIDVYRHQHRTPRRPAMGPVCSCLVWVLVGALSCGCAHVPELTLSLQDDLHVPERKVVVFVVDGMDAERIARMIDEGRLPHIRRRFVDNGARFTRAFGVFPSVTYANCSSIITGRYPADHGIIGNSWYEPSSATFRDYRSYHAYLQVNDDLLVPTLFQLLPEHLTLNLHYIMSTGADLNYTLGTRSKIYWWLGLHEASDHKIVNSMRKARNAIRMKGSWPALTVAYMPSADEIGHHHGPDSPEYARALENIDRIIGRFMEAYAEAGLDASTYFILISDHSMVATPEDRRVDLARWFREEAGLRVWTGAALPDREARRREILARYDMILNVEAGRVARIYLPGAEKESPHRQEGHHEEWPQIQHARELTLNHPAVDLCIMPASASSVEIVSRQGRAVIKRDIDGPPRYSFVCYEGDPLGYRRHEQLASLLDGRWIPDDQVLSLTADTDYPDLIRQAVDLFRSERAGDAILTAADEWGFHPSWKGGHGSALRRDMQIPLYVAGPGIPAGEVETPVRSVDLVPTVLAWLGVEEPREQILRLDGKPLQSSLELVP